MEVFRSTVFLGMEKAIFWLMSLIIFLLTEAISCNFKAMERYKCLKMVLRMSVRAYKEELSVIVG